MGDIKRAIETEMHYIEQRLEGLETVPLSIAIEECGYCSLEEYFAEKKNKMVSTLDYVFCTKDMTDIPEEIKKAVYSHTPTVFWPDCKRDFVWHGTDTIDIDLCDELGIDVLEMGYDGGTIVSSKDDFSFGVLMPEDVGVDSTYFLNRLSHLLSEYGMPSSVDGNDVLIDCEKVIGSMSFRTNGLFFFGCQISFVDHTERIMQLCNKKSGKTAGYVDSNKMTKETLKREVMSWLREQGL